MSLKGLEQGQNNTEELQSLELKPNDDTTKKYECEVCGHRTKYACWLRKHMQSHTGEKPYECDICRAKYASRRSLNNHMKIHSGDQKPIELQQIKPELP